MIVIVVIKRGDGATVKSIYGLDIENGYFSYRTFGMSEILSITILPRASFAKEYPSLDIPNVYTTNFYRVHENGELEKL